MANYTKGKIAIPNVTGNIVITITAVPQALENAFPSKFYETDGATLYNGLGYKTGYRFNSKRSEVGGQSNDAITGYLDITGASKITVSGATNPQTTGGYWTLCYDANHSVITTFPKTDRIVPNGEFTHDAVNPDFSLPANAKYIRFMVNKDNCTGTPPALTVVLE